LDHSYLEFLSILTVCCFVTSVNWSQQWYCVYWEYLCVCPYLLLMWTMYICVRERVCLYLTSLLICSS